MYTNLSSSSSSPGGRVTGEGELGGTGLDAELVGDNARSEMAAGAGG